MLNSSKIKYSISIQIFTEKGFKNSFVDFLRRAKTPILRSNYMMELNSVLTGNQISFSVGKFYVPSRNMFAKCYFLLFKISHFLSDFC